MRSARAFGLAIMLIGIVYIIRSSRVPTYSRVGMVAGGLFVVVGALYMLRARRPAA